MRYSGGFVLERCPTVKSYMIDSTLIKNKKLFYSLVSLPVSDIANGLWPCWPFFVFQLLGINLIFQSHNSLKYSKNHFSPARHV